MRLWTYHPPNYRIDDPGLIINPKLGPYWNEPLTPFYKKVLPILHKMLGTDQFIWCCTVPNAWLPIEGRLLWEWELSVHDSQIVGFIQEPIWDAIVKGSRDVLEKVVLAGWPIEPDRCISALVKIPLSPGMATCRGRLVNRLWREEAEFLRTRPDLHQVYIKRYRGFAANPTASNIARKMDADRADYLEEFLGLKAGKPN